MKKLLILLPLLSCFFCMAQVEPYAVKLAEEKDFFELRNLIQNPNLMRGTRQYCEAISMNAFGNNKLSNSTIHHLLEDYGIKTSDSLYQQLMEVMIDNYYKTGEFGKAWETTRELLKNGGEILDSTETKDLINTGNIWKALSQAPAQQVRISTPLVIPFTRDMAKLINVPVMVKKDTIKALFDTGANISVITENTAKKFPIKILAEGIKVESINGGEVIAKVGVIPSIKIGDAEVLNPYFLVFDDKDLSFAGGLYKINMIIGFPIIRQMGEIQFDLNQKTLTLGTSSDNEEQNLCLDGLTPLVRIVVDDQPMMLSFDSGADKTMFYPRFYDFVKEKKEYLLEAGTTSLGGAGGAKKMNIFTLDRVDLQVAESVVSVKNADVYPEPIKPGKEFLYGNLGQDVLSSRGKFVINLDKMYFKLKN